MGMQEYQVYERDGKYYETYYHEQNSNRISACDGYKTREITQDEYDAVIRHQKGLPPIKKKRQIVSSTPVRGVDLFPKKLTLS